ncbi:hypothetical protein [Streptomyces sp. NBC_00046]|uniref:hypothetical protein n=1 Tax=Streptomyces sp. NBC_00046 TaxID=2975626 RepID=UPI00324738C4
MRPVRIVTGTAASAVTIATLGFLTAGPSAYADDAGAQRISSADAVSRTAGGLGTRATDDEASGDGAGSGSDSGSGTGTPFSLDNLSGLIAPSLLDSASASASASGRDTTGGDEDTDRGESAGRGEGTDRGDSSSSGNDNSSSSGHESSGGRESWSPSEKGSGKHDGSSSGDDSSSSSGHDSSSSGRRPSDSGGPTGPTGHVKTGVGGSVRPDTTQIAAGAGVLAATAVGGAWLLRRRASGTQGAG